jgi:hypothetical protein
MPMIRTTVFLALLLAAAGVAANQEPPKLTVAEGDWAAQRAQIEKDLADGKTYAEISSADRAKVQDSLARISAALSGVASADALPEDTKAQVFNDQETVNTILTAAEADSRMVCRREVVTGSHREKTVCLSVADRRQLMEQSQQDLRSQRRTPLPVKE